ncbi:penicillin-binding transpeptidase domain-containing protein [Crocinitomicaceae bacterium]|nr:penicillin-binding transpeptidase domain-containing protein [Crocinitomicaceae bacterium]
MKYDSRKYVIITFIALIGIVYALKLFYMQVLDDTWKLRAQEIAEKRREITPPRAVILDRNGKKVVQNKTYYNLMMREETMKDLDTAAFAKLIGWEVEDVKARFKAVKKEQGKFTNKQTNKLEDNYRPYRAYPFLKEMTADEMSTIVPHLENFPGFWEEVSSMRYYPYGNASNVLGYLAEANESEVGPRSFYNNGDYIGRAGIERYYEDQIRGSKGIKYIVQDAVNDQVASFANGKYDTTAVQAEPIHLGLDIELQEYGEKLMQNKKGCIVAIEPATGEILALISSPSYDPNLMVGKKNIQKNYPDLLNDPNKPLFPRPLASQYMPGSTFKLIQSLIGMQEGVITKDSGFPCNKSVVGCHNHPSAQSVTQAVQMSCNPYFYAVIRRVIHQHKKRDLYEDAEVGLGIWAEYMHSFGLGKKLDSDLTGITSGVIPDPAYYDKWYGHLQWKFSTIRSISIGQGEVQLTPLQLANVAAIMANRGWYYTPHVVKSIGDNGPLKRFKQKNYTKVERKYFDPVVEGMRRCVHEAGGTARLARIPGMTVCGKTGTVENFTYLKGGKVLKKPNHSVFICFAPMEQPKIAVSVFIENAGGGGGTWAAPIASLIIEKYLNGEISEATKSKEQRILDAKLSLWE